MIELTEEQARALAANGKWPVEVVDPRTGERLVLLRADDHAKLVEFATEYDDEDFTDEDRAALMWEAHRALGWDEDEYPEYNEPEPT